MTALKDFFGAHDNSFAAIPSPLFGEPQKSWFRFWSEFPMFPAPLNGRSIVDDETLKFDRILARFSQPAHLECQKRSSNLANENCVADYHNYETNALIVR